MRFAGLIDPDVPVTPNAEPPSPAAHRYLCNADKCQYLDKAHLGIDDYGIRRSPLPCLPNGEVGIVCCITESGYLRGAGGIRGHARIPAPQHHSRRDHRRLAQRVTP